MNEDRADRVQAALELLEVMNGGAIPAPERLKGVTADEIADAENLFGTDLDVSLPLRRRHAARMAFLVIHAPGAPSIAAAEARLSPQERTAYEAITGEES